MTKGICLLLFVLGCYASDGSEINVRTLVSESKPFIREEITIVSHGVEKMIYSFTYYVENDSLVYGKTSDFSVENSFSIDGTKSRLKSFCYSYRETNESVRDTLSIVLGNGNASVSTADKSTSTALERSTSNCFTLVKAKRGWMTTHESEPDKSMLKKIITNKYRIGPEEQIVFRSISSLSDGRNVNSYVL